MNEPKVENNKEIKKVYTIEETKKIVMEHAQIGLDTSYILKEIAKGIIPKFVGGTDDEKQLAKKELGDKAMEVLRAFENDTRIALMESFDDRYRSFSKEFCEQITKDYACTTSVEKALAGNITNSYIRILDCSRRLNNDLGDPGQSITENRTKYMAMLSKQIDRAHRQFLSGVMMLKQLKAPTIEMNIKTTNAFVSQNQQINNTHEINESK